MAGAAETRAGVPCRITTRVRYPETDRMGVVWHGHYLAWFELGRTELMRSLGCPYAELEDRSGIHFPVIAVGALYHAPAKYDERIHVDTRLVEANRVRVRFEYEVSRESDGGRLASGFSEHASVDRDGKPARLPAELSRRLRGEVARDE